MRSGSARLLRGFLGMAVPVLAFLGLPAFASAAPTLEPPEFRPWADLSPGTRDVVDRMTDEYARWEWRLVCLEETSRIKGGEESCRQCRGYQRMEPKAAGDTVGEVIRFHSGECSRSGSCAPRDIPEPLDWLALLRDPLRSSLRFAEETRRERLEELLVLRFSSSAPSKKVDHVRAWSGEFIIDKNAGALREVRARPTWDGVTREARRLRYQTAMPVNLIVFGFKLAPKATTLDLVIRFENVARGLAWPSALELQKREAVTRDDDAVVWTQNVVYHSLRFFESGAKETLDSTEAAP